MKIKSNLILTLILASTLAMCGLSFAADLAVVSATLGTPDVREINEMTPGANKTFLGTRLQGPLATGSTAITSTSYAADNDTGGTTITTASAVITTPATWGTSTTLNDGYINQQLTFVLETDGGKDHTITPKTKTGYSSITMADANDSITVKYVSDTLGWVIVGNSASTVN